VSFALTLCLVLLAFFGIASLSLAIMIAIAWHAGLKRTLVESFDLLAMRLLPAGGGAFLVLTVVLPAFLIYEPPNELEPVGPLVVALALFSVVAVADGVRRGLRACLSTRSLFISGPVDRWPVKPGLKVDIVDVDEPIVAVVGAWQPRIVAARCVVDSCSQEEFSLVVAHEAAHVSARDNVKLLLLIASPDALAWIPFGAALTARWRVAAEFAADECATGHDPRKRVDLASALIKVARLSTASSRTLPTLCMPVGVDDVDGRVRRLLTPSPRVLRTSTMKVLVASALLLPVVTVPAYALIHEFIEILVGFGH
jgi:Zn-dependent protease with chaperone function